MNIVQLPGTITERLALLMSRAPGIAHVARLAALSGKFNWSEHEALVLREYDLIEENGAMTDDTRRALSATPEEVAKLPPKKQIRKVLADNRQAVYAAIPSGVNAARLLELANQAVTQNPELLKCWTPSLLGGILRAASLGLELNTQLGQAYLIPFRNSVKIPGTDRYQKRTDAQFILGYRGMIALAARSPGISHIKANVVYAQDDFDYQQGTDDYIRHKPHFKRKPSHDDIVAAYAIGVLKDGQKVFVILDRAEIEERRQASKNRSTSGPWDTWFPAMAQKSAVRALFSLLPITGTLYDIVQPDSERVELTETGGLLGFREGGAAETGFPEYKPEAPATPGPEPEAPATPGPEPEAPATPGPEPEPAWPQNVAGKGLPPIWVDKNGEQWNENIHATAKTGLPSMNQDGTFRRRRGAKPHPAAAASPEESPAPPAEGKPSTPAPRGNPRMPDGSGPTPEPKPKGHGLSAKGIYNGPQAHQIREMIETCQPDDNDRWSLIEDLLRDFPDTEPEKERLLALLAEKRPF